MYTDFYNSLLPGNYALTKSMELTKIKASGTLWYTKKFLVLYYYIFLTNDIYTKQYISNIVKSFDVFINSLPSDQQTEATSFFYSDSPALDPRSTDFKTFNSFTDYSSFQNEKEKREYDLKARKYYFSLLMGVGGQTGIKKLLKEKIQESTFCFTEENVKKCIIESAISVSYDQINANGKISDNSIKYVLSEQAINECENLFKTQNSLSKQEITDLVTQYPNPNPNYQIIKNDLHAFLRNERQILFYYGFVHSKSSGANDVEFSSLTPIGQASLMANFYEFLAIWEHQKFKMISQPVTCAINDIPSSVVDFDKFGISFSPYLDILTCLERREKMTLDEYMFIVSRKKHMFSEEDWVKEEDQIFSNLNDIKTKVASFGRIRDINDEDGRKELLKYLLGLRADLKLDVNKNPLGCLKLDTSWIVTNKTKLKCITSFYEKLNNYKLHKYKDLFLRCEEGLKKKYIQSAAKQKIVTDAQTKIRWDLYNIHQDKLITLSIIYLISSCSYNYNILDLKLSEMKDVSLFAFYNFPRLLKSFGIKTLNKSKEALKLVLNAIKTENYLSFTDEIEIEKDVEIYKKENAADLFERITKISSEYTELDGNRQRNNVLINLLKSYYVARFIDNGLLKCECCGKETFVTEAGEPYVEFHHLIPFNIALGPDHYLNLYALCPNCHRKIHYLQLSSKGNLYQDLDKNNYLDISIEGRLKELKEDRILRSYHLEFLLAENAITQAQYDSIAA